MYLWPAGQGDGVDGDWQGPGLIVEISPSRARPGQGGGQHSECYFADISL